MNKQQADLLADALRHPGKYGITKCAVCGSPSVRHMGIFCPTKSFQKRIGAPKDKDRLVVYALCSPCFDQPDKLEKVEAAILRDMEVQ